jgi:hypothetical protein
MTRNNQRSIFIVCTVVLAISYMMMRPGALGMITYAQVEPTATEQAFSEPYPPPEETPIFPTEEPGIILPTDIPTPIPTFAPFPTITILFPTSDPAKLVPLPRGLEEPAGLIDVDLLLSLWPVGLFLLVWIILGLIFYFASRHLR